MVFDISRTENDAAESRNQKPQPEQVSSGWQSMETAPKDGTAIQAEIPDNGSDNIIAWAGGLVDADWYDCGGWSFVENQEPPDCWTDGICWEQNEDGIKSVYPVRWKHLGGS
jgi:hypothetical protein